MGKEQLGVADISGTALLDKGLVDSVKDAARRSPRLRMNHNFHAGPGDNPHRFLNVLCRGTYVTPHRHIRPPKSEAFLVLQGRAAVFIFDDSGAVQQGFILGNEGEIPDKLAEFPQGFGVDLPAGVWHTVVALTDTVVCYEVKPGPWEPASDKDFAPWAPREGQSGTAEYLASLIG